MKVFKSILYLSFVLIIQITYIQCTSTPKLQKESPTAIKVAYFQKWNAGIEEGGSGTNVYIEISDSSMILDSMSFRGKITKLQRDSKNTLLYVGRFKSYPEDSKQKSNWSFQLKDNECVVSYIVENRLRYFKIRDINERKILNYPALPSNR